MPGTAGAKKNCLHRNVSEMPGTAGIRKTVVAEMPGRTAPTFRRDAILENAFAEMPGTARIEKSSLPKCWHNAGSYRNQKTSSPKCRKALYVKIMTRVPHARNAGPGKVLPPSSPSGLVALPSRPSQINHPCRCLVRVDRHVIIS